MNPQHRKIQQENLQILILKRNRKKKKKSGKFEPQASSCGFAV